MNSVVGFLTALATVTGVVVWAVGIMALVYYRPDLTPNSTLQEAVTGIRWSYAVAFFIAPLTLAGFQEGVPQFGFVMGGGFVTFIVLLQWWYPI